MSQTKDCIVVKDAPKAPVAASRSTPGIFVLVEVKTIWIIKGKSLRVEKRPVYERVKPASTGRKLPKLKITFNRRHGLRRSERLRQRKLRNTV